MSHLIQAARRLALAGVVALATSGVLASPGLAASEIVLEPDSVDFGVLAPGADTQRSFAVRNLGPDPVEFGDIYIVGDVDPFYFVGGSCPETGTFEGQCELMLEFAPDAAGDFEALLVVEGGPDDEPGVAHLTARSRPPGQLVPSVPQVDFGSVPMGGRSAERVVRIQNDGGTPIQVETVYANGLASIVHNGCSWSTVAPLSGCDVTLVASPYPGTLNRERAVQSGSLVLHALAWDQRPPRRLKLDVPVTLTAVRSTGAPLPSLAELASGIDGELGKLSREAIRFARRRTALPKELPTLGGAPTGLFDLALSGRVGKRWVSIARASAAVNPYEDLRPLLRWTKRGKRLLKRTDFPVQLKAVARYRASDRSIAEEATARLKLRPAKGDSAPRKKKPTRR